MTGRDAALRALLACRKSGAWSDGALKELLRGMDRREAALASRLCYGVLQNRLLLDWQLARFTKLEKLQPAVHEILRLALYQLTLTDKIPASAAVNEAVEQTKRFANPQAARLVNAVLRNLLRAGELPQPQETNVKYSHPAALAALFEQQFGRETAQRLMKSHNEAPETVLQINRLKATEKEVMDALAAEGISCAPHQIPA